MIIDKIIKILNYFIMCFILVTFVELILWLFGIFGAIGIISLVIFMMWDQV